jgi:excisionase family DNA binding protein
MREFVTPKQVARAIQVSESSVKRWCDKGAIPSQKTAGGHRRIPLAGLLAFLRDSDQVLVRPEVIGLPATTGQSGRVIDRAAERLTEALVRGDEEPCRRILLDLYLAEHSIARICDQVVTPAFASIGNQWECGQAHVYQERRACEITLRVLHELRALLPPPPAAAPRAIGGAIEGDQYDLGTTMAELVLIDSGWNAASLGNNLPLATLGEAIGDQRPRLFWISCSHIRDHAEFLRGYTELYEQFGLDVAFVVGGRSLVDSVRQRMKYAAYCDNMQHLEAFAQTLRGASERRDH